MLRTKDSADLLRGDRASSRTLRTAARPPSDAAGTSSSRRTVPPPSPKHGPGARRSFWASHSPCSRTSRSGSSGERTATAAVRMAAGTGESSRCGNARLYAARRGDPGGTGERGVMAAYLIIDGAVTDAVKWAAYRAAVLPLIESFGGRHLNGPGGKLLEGVDGWTGRGAVRVRVDGANPVLLGLAGLRAGEGAAGGRRQAGGQSRPGRLNRFGAARPRRPLEAQLRVIARPSLPIGEPLRRAGRTSGGRSYT